MARIIETKAIITGEEKLSPLLDKLAKKFEQVQKASKTAVGVDKMAASLARVNTQMTAIEKFNAAKIGFVGSRDNLRRQQEAVDRHAKAVAAMKSPDLKAAAAEQARLAKMVDRASQSYEQQKAAVMGARRALVSQGVPIDNLVGHQAKLAAAVDRTNAALQRQQRWAGRRQAVGSAVAGPVGSAIGGYGALRFAKKAVTSAAGFDLAVRGQRNRTEGNIDAATQAEILIPQAKRIGQETQFSNTDVVQAQTVAMQGLPIGLADRVRAEVGVGIVEHVKNYAIVMETDLKQASETIRTYLQTAGKDISTKEKALRESQLAVNRIVRMAKLGGMTADDVPAYLRFGAAANSVVGVDEDAFLAIGALAKRGGLRGDEAGTFMRQVAGKLAAPTKQGLTAMRAAGIDYNSYMRMPKKLETGRLESQFQQEVGVSFTPAVRKRLDELLTNPAIIGDRNKFTEAVTGAVGPLFPRTRRGKMAASDKAKIAKTAGGFYGASAAGLDAQGLFDKLLSSDLSLMQLNKILDYRQGGKFAVTQKQREEYVASRKLIRDTDKDPNFAKKKADDIMGGLGGSLENLKGSFENLQQAIGEANEGLLKMSFDWMGSKFDWVSNLSKEGRQAATALGAIAAIGGAGFVMKQLFSGFGLSTSAGLLDKAAFELMAAAKLQGGSKVATVATSAAPVAAAAATPWLTRAAPFLRYGLGYGGTALAVGYGVYGMYDSTRPFVGQNSGERMKNARGGSMRDVYRKSFNAERERLGIAPLGGGWPNNAPFSQVTPWPTGNAPSVKAELSGVAKVTGEAKITIEIPGLPSRTVNVPLSGVLTNGPGSLGTSSPDAAAHPSGVGHN